MAASDAPTLIDDTARLSLMMDAAEAIVDQVAPGSGKIHISRSPDHTTGHPLRFDWYRNGHTQPRWSINVSVPHDTPNGHHWPAQLSVSGIVGDAVFLRLLTVVDALMWDDRER